MSSTKPLGLPENVRACLFDLDGVLTETAKVHAAAWKEMFDAYLKARADKEGEPFVAFDAVADYDTYVDGKPRADGTRSFLESRHIDLPEGSPDDSPDAETINGLGNAKNKLVMQKIKEQGVEAYVGSVRYVHAVRAAGLHRAVVSSSAKPRVERQVPYVRSRFFAGEEFVDLADGQRRVEKWCTEGAGMRIHGTTRCRPIEAFRGCCSPLPCSPTTSRCSLAPRSTGTTMSRLPGRSTRSRAT
ncbi:MAG: HAD family hydrolase [Acidimicrobiales bacterium]